MFCQNCGKNEANTHIKQIINGAMTESHLCSFCANNLGYTDMFSGFSLNLSEFFGGILGDMLPSLTVGNIKRCEKCGSSFDDIVRSGMIGCGDCYRTFYDKLLPSIQRIHGRNSHTGKTALITEKSTPIKSLSEQIEELKEEMQKAVKIEDFETAAKIRDQIKELKGGADSE